MGAAPEEYAKVAPPGSFIHVDDYESPAALAAYLLKVDSDDVLYNSYFKWKGTGEFVNTKFWCRICAMAHLSRLTGHRQEYIHVSNWWSGGRVCQQPGVNPWCSWRGHRSHKVSDYADAVRIFS